MLMGVFDDLKRGSGIRCLRANALAVLLLICVPSPAHAEPRAKSFPEPQMNGAAVDWCQSWATNCGQAGADQFCRMQGFERASFWTEVLVDRTFVIGSNQFCQGQRACGALRKVVCVEPLATPAVPPPPPTEAAVPVPPPQPAAPVPPSQPVPPPPTEACNFTGTWRDDLGTTLNVTQSGETLSGSAGFSDIAASISFSGTAQGQALTATYAPCGKTDIPRLQSGGKMSLTLSGCDAISGKLDDSTGTQLFDLSLTRTAGTPPSDACTGGSHSEPE
jgi:hypothetical protein